LRISSSFYKIFSFSLLTIEIELIKLLNLLYILYVWQYKSLDPNQISFNPLSLKYALFTHILNKVLNQLFYKQLHFCMILYKTNIILNMISLHHHLQNYSITHFVNTNWLLIKLFIRDRPVEYFIEYIRFNQIVKPKY
jgi:hypothetical protein